jgi:hypothetical protein
MVSSTLVEDVLTPENKAENLWSPIILKLVLRQRRDLAADSEFL